MNYVISIIFKIKGTDINVYFCKNAAEPFPIFPLGSEFLANFPSSSQFPCKIINYRWCEGFQVEAVVEGCKEISKEDANFLERNLCPEYKIARL